MRHSPSKSSETIEPTKRRSPSQLRSIKTIDTLFQAAAQILEREGEAGLTTNKVASVAGFSIGTLYQYFPSKDALTQAMGLRVRDQVLSEMEKYLNDLQIHEDFAQLDSYHLVKEAVNLVMKCMTLRGKNKSLLRLFWLLEPTDQTMLASQRMAEMLSIFFEQVNHPQIKVPTATEMYVITRMILGLVRYASLEKTSLLATEAMDEVLTKMVLSTLKK